MAKHAALYSDSIQSTQLHYISQNTCNASSHESQTNSQLACKNWRLIFTRKTVRLMTGSLAEVLETY